jgi:hypothetical protein
MALSVIAPVSPAIERTKKVLFQPFEIGKWFILGFTAFLSQLAGGGEGGGMNCNCSNPGGGGSGGPGGGSDGGDMEDVFDWVGDHLSVVLLIVAVIVLISIAVGMALTWLASRGEFMFLDGVVRNRGEVKRPWREFARLANSLFWFRFFFAVFMFVLVLLLLGGCLALAWPDIKLHVFTGRSAIALAAGIFVLILLALMQGIISMALHDFVVPIMYVRSLTVMPAWSEFFRAMLVGNIGTFILYLLFQIVIGIALGLIATAATCMTLCLAALPYVGSVILLPLSVFHRSYSLYFIEQFGPEWRVFAPAIPPLPDEPPGRFGHDPGDERIYRPR